MKCGLEIHQRICSRKLFCDCDASLRESPRVGNAKRILHPAVGETGLVDRAVAFEDSRKKVFNYQVNDDTSCLVETDSEPPHEVNSEALLTALSVAKHLKMFVPDELHVMRKTVIDGSNTGGFQRTMVVGLGTAKSVIPTSQGPVRVKDLELEEESARILSRGSKGTSYSLSGLGVPLIEIGTYPDIKSPEQAYEAALYLGELLRLTGKAQRGIGTIRQDVNVSVSGGARVEIKGFQELRELPRLVSYEVERQKSLISLSKELTGYKIRRVNVTEFFDESALFKGKRLVLGLVLPGFKGLLKRKLNPVKTLGSELADYARAYGVKGLIHDDEDLDKYKLVSEFSQVRNELGLKDDDLILVIAGDDDVIVKAAIEAVEARVYLLNDGVPEETRVASKDAASAYARPLPGGARMYPETDVSVIIPPEGIPRIESKQIIKKRLSDKINLKDDVIVKLILHPRRKLLESLIKKFPRLDSKLITRILIEAPKDVKKRFGKDVSIISDEQFTDLIGFVSDGVIVKDAVPIILSKLCDAPELSVSDIIGSYRQLGDAELKQIVLGVKKKHKGLSVKQLMGLVMKEVAGRASGKRVSELLA